MRNCRRRINWSEIPVEIVRSIAQHLKDNPENLNNFRSVCQKWRRATSISTLLPYDMGSETLFSSSTFLLSSPDSSSPPWIVTIVEISKGKFLFCHPLSGELFSNIPENFSLRHFNPRRLNLDFHMSVVKDKCSLSRALFCHDKVLLFSKGQCVPPMVDDCSLLVLFRGGQLGGSPPVKPEYQFGTELPWFDISYGSLDKFDDILCFNGVIYALDRLGKLYQMFTDQFAVLKIMVGKPIIRPEFVNKGCRKRLVGSMSSGKLYLIRKSYENEMIKVYELYKVADKKLWSWVKVESFEDGGDDHKVLFVSRSYSFFVSAAEFPGLKDCIIFSHDAFRPYSNSAESNLGGKEIQVFQLGDHHGGKYKPASSFPGFPVEVFSPPSWVLQAQASTFSSDPQSEPEEDEVMEPASTSQEAGASSKEHVSAPSCKPKSEEQSTEIPSTSAAQSKFASHLPGSDEKREKAPDISEKKVSCTVSAPVTSTSAMTSMECESKTKFYEGLDVRSNLLSTLQIVWNKHGNIVGEGTVRSRDMLACALESLAKIINMLQTTTARTLTDSLAKDLDSIMFDLQRVGLKVDWLVPFVEKALAIHKSKHMIESIMAIDKERAEVDEEEREFLVRSAKKKQELEEKRACVSTALPFPEPFHLDHCLGEGLF